MEHEYRPNVSEIYTMIVTIGGISSWEGIEEYISSSLIVPSNVPLVGHFHVDIHEFELLCELATRKHAKSLIDYLNRNNPQNVPLGYFLEKETLHPRRPKKIENLYNEKMKLIRKTLFR